MFTKDVLALSANGIGYLHVDVTRHMNSTSIVVGVISFLCFSNNSVYLFNSEPQKPPLCSTLWNICLRLTCEPCNVIRAVDGIFFLIKAGFVWPVQTGDIPGGRGLEILVVMYVPRPVLSTR